MNNLIYKYRIHLLIVTIVASLITIALQFEISFQRGKAAAYREKTAKIFKKMRRNNAQTMRTYEQERQKQKAMHATYEKRAKVEKAKREASEFSTWLLKLALKPFSICGNGTVEFAEDCDDGNNSNGDACTNSCNHAYCGDGHVAAGIEYCDDGNNSNSDACTNLCMPNVCGDGFLFVGVEDCDYRSLASLLGVNGCDSNCTLPNCGNGVIDPCEQCDDGNRDNTDSCTIQCIFNKTKVFH